MHIFSRERTILQEETKPRPVSTVPPLHLPFTQLSAADNPLLWLKAPGILSNRKHRFGPGLPFSWSCLHSLCRTGPYESNFQEGCGCGCPSSRQHQICLHVADQPPRLRPWELDTDRSAPLPQASPFERSRPPAKQPRSGTVVQWPGRGTGPLG